MGCSQYAWPRPHSEHAAIYVTRETPGKGGQHSTVIKIMAKLVIIGMIWYSKQINLIRGKNHMMMMIMMITVAQCAIACKPILISGKDR